MKRPCKQAVFALLVFVLVVFPAEAAGTTYYISPTGSDGNAGTTPEAPLQTFAIAVHHLAPGDTLTLLDGTYTKRRTGFFLANCSASARNGTEEAPITVRARHERRAWLKSDGSAAPFTLKNCSHWNVEGLRASSADYKYGAKDIVAVLNSDHIRVKRLLLHDANRYRNSSGLQITSSHHVLVEEVEMYYFHRHGIEAYKSDHIVIRRSYVHGRNATDLDDEAAWSSHGCCTRGGDGGYSLYFTSNSIVENSISTHSEQVGIVAGVETVLGNPGGQNNQVLGSISFRDLLPGAVQSRKFKDPDRPYTGPATGLLYRDYLVVGGQQIDEGSAFALTVGKEVTIDGMTSINTKHTPIDATPGTREVSSAFFLGCDRIGGCDYDVRDALFVDNGYSRIGSLLQAPDVEALDLLVEYSNAWNRSSPARGFAVSEAVDDSSGRYRHSKTAEPAKIGLGQGECLVFVPEQSNMSGAGKAGGDIGAEILYRYADGELTGEPLWDRETGEFPRGAVIEGSPNDPGRHEIVLANIHEHLNVNTNGCRLPYAVSTSRSFARERPGKYHLSANYPNPFNPRTTIRYRLPRPTRVRLAVYDLLGRRVRVLVDGKRPAGWHRATFEAKGLPGGTYLYRMEAGSYVDTGTMSLIK